MILPVIRRLLKEDLQRAGGEELPKWIDALLTPINEFIDRVTLALRNNLTFKDNMAGRLQTIEFTHGQEIVIQNSLRGAISGVVVLGCDPVANVPVRIDNWSWRPTGSSSIGLLFDFCTLQTTGNITSGSPSLSSLVSTSIPTSGTAIPAIQQGFYVIGSGIPSGTTVSSISGSTVTLSANASQTISSTLVKFAPVTAKVTFFIASE